LAEEIEVARPVIERSPCLQEATMVEIARTRSQDHLLALTKRPSLSEAVTDSLTRRGSAEVARALSRNAGARLSEEGIDRLMERAREDGALQALLSERADLPESCVATLVELAGRRVSQRLREELGEASAPAVERALSAASDRYARHGAAQAADASRRPAVRVAHEAGDASESAVIARIKAGDVDAALALMARLGRIPLATVRSAWHAPSYDPLLFVAKSLQFGWLTFKLLLAEKAGRMPPDGVLKGAFESFQKLSPETARRVVRFTVVRSRAPGSSEAH
jgi:uncharacterized protein (DUF2336 family)